MASAKATDDCLKGIEQCDRILATTLLPNVREQAERAKRSWEGMLSLESKFQATRDAIQRARCSTVS